MSTTLEALKRTPKGSLCYDHSNQWDKSDRSGKLRLLEQWSSLPPISPEAVQYINERAKRLSLESQTHKKQQTEGSLITGTNEEDVDGATLTVSPSISSTSNFKPQELRAGSGEAGLEQSSSVIGQFSRELDEQEKSLDDELMQEVSNDVQNRRKWIYSRLKSIRRKAEEERELERERREREIKLRQGREAALEKQRQLNLQQKIGKFEDEYKLYGEMMESKLKSGEEEMKEIMKKISERKEMEILQQLRRCLGETSGTIKQLAAIFNSCAYPHLLSGPIRSEFKDALTGVKDIADELTTLEQSGAPDSNQVDMLQSRLSGLQPKVVELKVAIDEINQRGEKEERQNEELLRQTAEKLEQEKKAKEKAEEEQRKRMKEKEEQTAANTAASVATTQSSKIVESASGKPPSDGTSIAKGGAVAKATGANNLGTVMPESQVELYSDLQDKLSQADAATKSFTTSQDPAVKKYRFQLQKAVTMTVNSISANSGEDLRDKISRLQRLLRGDTIEAVGRPLSIRNHPAAKMYCCNLLAKKLVQQGEDLVAANHEAAFPIAAVAVGIWGEFPDVGDFILAHFYSTCPVLVPFYVPKSKDMSEADYMKLQGYKVQNNGTVESEDMFLKRMGGYVRLYAAIVQTPPLPINPQSPQRHSLPCGWAWLARVLNLEPHPSLTATAVGDFLETAGHALLRKYNTQFKKVLLLLCKEYIPLIEKVTPVNQKGPLVRLKLFLEKCVAKGIPVPDGCLDDQFWRTRSQGIAFA